MRFPTVKEPLPPSPPGSQTAMEAYPVNRPHHQTLLDGEMVVDHDKATGIYTRRFLVYDIMAVNDELLVKEPFAARYKLIEDLVIRPRHIELDYIMHRPDTQTYQIPPLPYVYHEEPFSVRRKGFFPLHQSHDVLKFIETLSHESDGLILQVGRSN